MLASRAAMSYCRPRGHSGCRRTSRVQHQPLPGWWVTGKHSQVRPGRGRTSTGLARPGADCRSPKSPHEQPRETRQRRRRPTPHGDANESGRPPLSPAVMRHGGSPESEQSTPEAVTFAAQHCSAVAPGIVPHPSPPHSLPQMSGQHTSVLGSWTPVMPLSHTESFDAAAAGKAKSGATRKAGG